MAAIDKNAVTAHIKTFMRPDKFETCLKCAINAGLEHILVGYDGPDGEIFEKHQEICTFYSGAVNNLKLIRYPFNFGLSRTRNALIEETSRDTEYILQLDDDNYVPSNTLDIVPWFDRHPGIGMVGMGWLQYSQQQSKMSVTMDAADFEIVNGYLLKVIKHPKKMEVEGGLLFISPFDYAPNIAFFRRSVFDEVRWDNKYIIGGEHIDFYLGLKRDTTWKAAACPSLYVIHDPGGTKSFMDYRMGDERIKSEKYFLKKWKLKGLTTWTRMFLDSGRYCDAYEAFMKNEEKRIRDSIKKDEVAIADLNYQYLYKK